MIIVNTFVENCSFLGQLVVLMKSIYLVFTFILNNVMKGLWVYKFGPCLNILKRHFLTFVAFSRLLRRVLIDTRMWVMALNCPACAIFAACNFSVHTLGFNNRVFVFVINLYELCEPKCSFIVGRQGSRKSPVWRSEKNNLNKTMYFVFCITPTGIWT